MTFIDTHAHLFLEEFVIDLPSVIERARKVGISHIFMPNIDCSTIEPMLKVASLFEGYCFPMLGLHPTSVAFDYKDELHQMELLLNQKHNFIAIGEIGMDLYWDKTFIDEQIAAFDTQIQWSIDKNLPVVIHNRDAFDQTYQVLKQYDSKPVKGIFHSFTGTAEEAEKLLSFNGFKLGINGVVTFKKSNLPHMLKSVPLDKIVLETDSPYLAPVPNRGKRNESANVKDTLIKIAQIYELPVEEVARITTNNALEVFGMA